MKTLVYFPNYLLYQSNENFLSGLIHLSDELKADYFVPFISIKNINEPYKTNSIVLLGVSSALFGILGTYIGVKNALNVVTAINNISPEILINGFKTSLVTAYAGAIIMFFSALAWYYFVKKHNLYST